MLRVEFNEWHIVTFQEVLLIVKIHHNLTESVKKISTHSFHIKKKKLSKVRKPALNPTAP